LTNKQTTGRDNLGDFAPQFAHLNDDVLFGEVWSREDELSARDRSLITIAALMSAGSFEQLGAHLALGKAHGITREEASGMITHLALYCGWPKAWSAFGLAKDIYGAAK
jgi:4-carboxymuconolactone decarboxylase